MFRLLSAVDNGSAPMGHPPGHGPTDHRPPHHHGPGAPRPGAPGPAAPGQAPPARRSRLPWILGGAGCGCGLLVVAVVVVVLFALGILYLPPPENDVPPVSEQRVALVGGEFTELSAYNDTGDVTVTVTSLGTGIEAVEGNLETYTPTGRFVVVHMDIHNTSRDTPLVVPTMYRLRTVEGEDYETHNEAGIAAIGANGISVPGSLARDQVVSFINVYDVPEGMTPESLVLDGSAFPGEPVVLFTD